MGWAKKMNMNDKKTHYVGWDSSSKIRSRSTSPCSTDNDMKMFRQNQTKKRNLIENELKNIPETDKYNLSVLMKCMYSDYVEQDIEIKIVKDYDKTNILNTINDNKYDVLSSNYNLYDLHSHIDAKIYSDIWKEFDYNPFNFICKYCKQLKYGNRNYIDENVNNILCDVCDKKIKFNNKWDKSTPNDKLLTYGIEKLRILAKQKNIKGRSKMNKQELINSLTNNVLDSDFPIKNDYI